ncbi:hypothetical protein [Azospirillum sp. B506]|uniref:hypothetical protein n=1 Tax=Azospirillum sp. B506 TaxID=137721 RepID=UPI000345AF85|nr:hypothetical protein [Azospirillum sp. B506]
MTNVQTFMFALPAGTATMQVPVRTLDINGAPWFHATDVGKALGLETAAGMSQCIKALNSDERRKENKATLKLIQGWTNFA